ncbi:MAG: hypothetical protein NC328_02035 [Muribaculum sp.]|nr:hypothetical protein [Muribaculum sp.]
MKGHTATLCGIYAALLLILIFSNLKSCSHEPSGGDDFPVHDSLVQDTDLPDEDTEAAETTAAPIEVPDSIEGHSGRLRVAILWNFHGDADLHVVTPSGRCIDYKNPRDGASSGEKDVDNREGGNNAVENIYWQNPPNGTYYVYINYYRSSVLKGTGPVNVVVETTGESGQTSRRVFESSLDRPGQWKGICSFTYRNGSIQFASPQGAKPSDNACSVAAFI